MYYEWYKYASSHIFKHHHQKFSQTVKYDWSDLCHTRNQTLNHELWNWLEAWEWLWSSFNHHMSVPQSWHTDREAEKMLKEHEHEWDSNRCSTSSSAQSSWKLHRNWQICRLSDRIYKVSCRQHDVVNQVSSRTCMFMMNTQDWEVHSTNLNDM